VSNPEIVKLLLADPRSFKPKPKIILNASSRAPVKVMEILLADSRITSQMDHLGCLTEALESNNLEVITCLLRNLEKHKQQVTLGKFIGDYEETIWFRASDYDYNLEINEKKLVTLLRLFMNHNSQIANYISQCYSDKSDGNHAQKIYRYIFEHHKHMFTVLCNILKNQMSPDIINLVHQYLPY
jgi:hypothetical protein